MRPLAQAQALGGLWGALLILLAALWVQSPFLGSMTVFSVWSLPAAALLTGTWLWLDRMGIHNVPRGPGILAALVLLWVGASLVALTGVGPELALDGLILRDAPKRTLGKVLQWVPVVFGVALSVAGLASALEARYRIVHGPGTGEAPAGDVPTGPE